MNYYAFAAGVLILIEAISHFTIGAREHMYPILKSKLEKLPKKALQSIFHYFSVYLVLTAVSLLAYAFNVELVYEVNKSVISFIGITYTLFAFIQIFVAFGSKLNKPLLKLYRWIYWVLIAFLCLLATF